MATKNNKTKIVLQQVQEVLKDEDLNVVWNVLLDVLEEIIKNTKTKIDDAVFIPLIALLRKRFKI